MGKYQNKLLTINALKFLLHARDNVCSHTWGTFMYYIRTALRFLESAIWQKSHIIHKVDKITSESSYKTLQLREIHDYKYFYKCLKFVKILSGLKANCPSGTITYIR